MQHSRILEKNAKSNLYVQYDDSLPISFRKIQVNNDGSFIELIADTITYNNVFWVSSVQMPNEDCYIILVIYRDDKIIDYVVLRNGVPDLKVFYTDYKYVDTDIVEYKQYSKSGDILDIGNIIYLDLGVGYFKPINEFESLIEFIKNNNTLESVSSILKLPYLAVKIEQGTGSGYTSNGLFVDTGFSNYGFIGEKNSYFDLDLGEWILDSLRTAKAEDLAKAVAFKYNLEWVDRTSPLHIYNYIKYFRTYDEENGRFLLYAPSITPSSDINNFDLISTDELGNTFILGISMLLIQDLETVGEGSVGVYIPFK